MNWLSRKRKVNKVDELAMLVDRGREVDVLGR